MDKNSVFFGWLFASQKSEKCIAFSRLEFALQARAFQGYVRTSCYLHSFAPLRNWLRQPFQSLPRVKRGTDLVSYFHNRIIDIRLVLSQQIYKIHFPASSNPLYHVPYIFSSFPKRSYSPIEFLLHLI